MTLAIQHRHAVFAVFILTYSCIAVGRVPGLKLNRTGIALLGAIGVMLFSGRSPAEIAASVNWPTILLLFGFFVVSAQLCLSGFYDWVALLIVRGLRRPDRLLLVLIPSAAGLSAFLNNDIVCYALAPVVTAALIEMGTDPVPFLIAMGISSNIGAAATPVGNPQNMLIGEVAHLSFPHYMLWSLPPVIFALIVTYAMARILARDKAPFLEPAIQESPAASRPLDPGHAIKGGVILLAVIGLFFTQMPREIVVLIAAGIHLASRKFRTEDILGLVDWPILVLFASLFVVSDAFQATGYAEQLVRWLEEIGFDPIRPTNLAILTAGLAALINNAPAVMLVIKIVPLTQVSTAYVIALANSFGGNLVMTASIANLIVAQQARRRGISISFGRFARMGVPIAIVSLLGLIVWARISG